MIQNGSDKAAIAWAIAKNIEQSNGLKKQRKSYKDGILDGKNPDDDITEDYQGIIPPGGIILDLDQNGDGCGSSGEFITNMEKGFWVKQTDYDDPNANSCHIYYYPLINEYTNYREVGLLWCDEYSPTGEIINEYHEIYGAYYPYNWKFFTHYYNNPRSSYKAINLIISPSDGQIYSHTLTEENWPYYTIEWIRNSWVTNYIRNGKYISTTPLTSIDI